MKKSIRLFLCWLLALSLAGFPLASISVNVPVQQDEEPCEHMSMDMAQHDTAVITATDRLQLKACCQDCEGDCSCASDMTCHTASSHQIMAMFSAATAIRYGTILQHFSLLHARYHSRDTEPEITPPIV
jgi:hypothetical protein